MTPCDFVLAIHEDRRDLQAVCEELLKALDGGNYPDGLYRLGQAEQITQKIMQRCQAARFAFLDAARP